MVESGPPIHFWCMRFEGKHRESTVPASVSNCKKNIAQTIVTKHQLKFACQLYTMNINPVFEEGPSSSCKLSDLSVTFADSLNREPNFLNTVIHKVNWVNKNGSSYKPNMVICTNENNDEPLFGLDKFIFTQNQTPFFIYQKLRTMFRSHENVYEVTDILPACFIISYNDLFYFKLLSLTLKIEKYYIILRHYL